MLEYIPADTAPLERMEIKPHVRIPKNPKKPGLPQIVQEYNATIDTRRENPITEILTKYKKTPLDLYDYAKDSCGISYDFEIRLWDLMEDERKFEYVKVLKELSEKGFMVEKQQLTQHWMDSVNLEHEPPEKFQDVVDVLRRYNLKLKKVTREEWQKVPDIGAWLDKFEEAIKTYNIKPENMYAMADTDFLRTMNVQPPHSKPPPKDHSFTKFEPPTKVDDYSKQNYLSMECISATGRMISPFVGVPESKRPDFSRGRAYAFFACWGDVSMSPEMLEKWISHFHDETSPLLQSPDEYRLVLLENHAITFKAYCQARDNKIIFLHIPPGASKLLNPFDHCRDVTKDEYDEELLVETWPTPRQRANMTPTTTMVRAKKGEKFSLTRDGLPTVSIRSMKLDAFRYAREVRIKGMPDSWLRCGLYPLDRQKVLDRAPTLVEKAPAIPRTQMYQSTPRDVIDYAKIGPALKRIIAAVAQRKPLTDAMVAEAKMWEKFVPQTLDDLGAFEWGQKKAEYRKKDKIRAEAARAEQAKRVAEQAEWIAEIAARRAAEQAEWEAEKAEREAKRVKEAQETARAKAQSAAKTSSAERDIEITAVASAERSLASSLVSTPKRKPNEPETGSTSTPAKKQRQSVSPSQSTAIPISAVSDPAVNKNSFKIIQYTPPSSSTRKPLQPISVSGRAQSETSSSDNNIIATTPISSSLKANAYAPLPGLPTSTLITDSDQTTTYQKMWQVVEQDMERYQRATEGQQGVTGRWMPPTTSVLTGESGVEKGK